MAITKIICISLLVIQDVIKNSCCDFPVSAIHYCYCLHAFEMKYYVHKDEYEVHPELATGNAKHARLAIKKAS